MIKGNNIVREVIFMKKTTEQLLESLRNKRSYNDFFNEELEELYFASVSEYLETLVVQKGLKKGDVITRANLDKNYAYQIFNGNKKNPSRNKLIMLAFGMQLTPEETRKLLKIAGLSELYIRVPRDSAIIFCLDKKMTLIDANEMLDDLGYDILE